MIIFDHLRLFHIILNQFGSFGSNQDNLGPFCTMWVNLGAFGTICDDLETFEISWDYFGQFGSFPTIGDHSGP